MQHCRPRPDLSSHGLHFSKNSRIQILSRDENSPYVDGKGHYYKWVSRENLLLIYVCWNYLVMITPFLVYRLLAIVASKWPKYMVFLQPERKEYILHIRKQNLTEVKRCDQGYTTSNSWARMCTQDCFVPKPCAFLWSTCTDCPILETHPWKLALHLVSVHLNFRIRI